MCRECMLKTYKKGESYDFSEIFEKMKSYFKTSNLVIGNLETPITKDENILTNEKYSFASPYEFAKSVYDSGIRCVSTANNHCLDRGIEGIYSTIDCLNEIGIKHTGIFKTRDKHPLIIEINGIKIGILSYTYGTNAFSNNNYLKNNEKYCVNLFQNQELSNKITRYCYFNGKKLIPKVYNKLMRYICKSNANCQLYERKEYDFNCKRKLRRDISNIKKAGAELVVMLMHTGGQYNKMETKSTKKLTKYLLKQGINIIVGNHEHVVHGGEFTNIKENKLVTYSLGNFNGIDGVYAEPFNTMSEYSIAWNIYIKKENNNVKIEKTTFLVLKTIPTEIGGIQTIPVYDLINQEEDREKKEKLIRDMYEIAYKFSNKRYNQIEKEYII